MAGRDVARVVNRCNQAKDDKRLDLSRCDLTRIPDAIFLLLRNIELKYCSLSQNLIKRIPSKFGTKFPTLTELILSSNHISSLPDELRLMEGLTTLDISHNDFAALPQVVYKLDNLKIIKAEKNKIKELDVQQLKRLSSISEVNMQDNPLTPDMYTQLTLLSDDITMLLTPQDSEFDSVD
ncbi:unnamed protein product [Lymnaea stagnalis]|uniref:Disease resistance R13L4/SHOC-2-like LRR domain-containing protein n=1 Tax=Lymnaea stagnalis TaxID=6523 RepID=A0AAV2ICG0_LYMST